MNVIWYRFTPRVIDPSQPQPVLLEAKTEGSPGSASLELQSPASIVTLKDDGTGGDKTAGDGIFTVQLTAADVLKNFTPDDVNRNFVGFLRLHKGNETVQSNVFADVLTADIPAVQIRNVSATVQWTDHLINLVDPAFFNTFDVAAVTQKLYSQFEDSYDFLNLVYELPHLQNRHHVGVRNDVQGIGLPTFDNSAAHGSAGRLLGYTVFPIPQMFDGAAPTYQHELGHQWLQFLNLPPLDSGIPHYPLSDLASCIMGWSTPGGQGLQFGLELQPSGSDFELVPSTEPKVFKDLSLYAMGMLPAAQVQDHFVFKDQSTAPGPGPVPASALTKVTMQNILQAMGPRVPAASKARKKFRIATVLVTRNGLAPDIVMRLYDHFAARAEGTRSVPYSDGFSKGMTLPFHLSTQKLGRLDTRIKRRILVDASRDGGVWWFPQTGPFSKTAKHQGKPLADHLRSLGHTVDELPRPTLITARLLGGYDLVIRAAGIGSYQASEVKAYRGYVKAGGSVLLLADFGPSDSLASGFGLKFSGTTRGANLLNTFTPHPVTQGVGPLQYKVGGGLIQKPATAQILGKLSSQSFLDLDADGVKDPGEISAPAVLGAMTFGKGRIVFCGDTNLWEGVPQPLTKNTVKWLTEA